MRSNKLRLAALAMSFVMAASAVPSVAFAEDLFTSDGTVSEEVAFDDGAEFVEEPVVEFIEPEVAAEDYDVAPVAAEEEGTFLLEDDVHFFYLEAGHEDYTVQYTPKFGIKPDGEALEGTPFDLKDSEGKFIKATKVNEQPATCEAGPSFQLTVEIPGFGTYTSKIFYVGGTKEDGALGHEWGDVETRYDPYPTCLEDGVAFPDQKCTRCGEWRSDNDSTYKPEKVTAPATGHVVDSSKPTTTEYENLKNCELNEAGVPEATDSTKDWSYDIVTYGTCKICGATDVEVKRETIKNEGKPEADVPYIDVPEDGNIATYLEYDATTSNNLTIKDEEVVFEDCFKPGKYNVVVDHVDATTGKTVTTILKSYTIAAPHHVADVINFYTADGKTLLATVDCQSDDDIKAEDNADAVKEGLSIVRKDGELLITSLSCKDPYTYVKEVLCVNKDEKTEKAHVISKTTEVAPAEGPHIIDNATKAKVAAFIKETARVYDDLEEMVPDYNPGKAPETDDNPYVDIVLGTANCTTAGTVLVQYRCFTCGKVIETQTVTLTKAIGHKNADPVAENYVAPTCTKEGSFDSVVYCKICNAEISRRKVSVPATGHKYLTSEDGDKYSDNNVVLTYEGDKIVIGEPYYYGEREYQAGDTFEEGQAIGEFRRVYLVASDVCTVCGELAINDDDAEEGTVIPVPGKVVKVVPGSHYCEEKVLTVEATYQQTTGKKAKLTKEFEFPYYVDTIEFAGRTPHDPLPAVQENVVPSTETTEGSFDSVVYCKLCGHEISRTKVTTPVATHVHDWKKVEAKEATCTEDGNKEYYFCEACGSYSLDGVEVCAQEETVVKADHKYEEVVEVPATCTEAGVKAHVVCSVCGKKFIADEEAGEFKEVESDDELVIEALGHELEKVEAKAPTATEEGNIEYYVCTRCGKFFSDAEGTTEITEEETKLAKLELPAKVTGVKTNAYPSDVYPSKGYMKVTWTAVEGADDYRVSYRALGETAWTKVLTGGANSITLDETALTVGTSYEIRVAAGKEGVFGPRSDVLRRYYESVTPTYTRTSDSITVTWPAVEKGSSYMVIYSENKSMKPYKTIIVRNGILTATLKNLKAGTKYYVRVRPYDKTGKTATGALSPLKCVTTKK